MKTLINKIKKANLFTKITILIFTSLFIFGVCAKKGYSQSAPSPTYNLTIYTNLPATNGTFLLSTNPAKIVSVQILAGSAAETLLLYDINYAGTNYTNAQYTTLISYTTNQIYTNISPLTGTTNLETNSYLFTGTITNAANTNNPLPYSAFVAQPNTMVTFPVFKIFSRGISVVSSTNAGLIINYRVND